jgi:TldD protein
MEIKSLKDLLKKQVLRLEQKALYASAFAGSKQGRQVSVTTSEKNVHFLPPSKGVTLTAFDGHYFHEKSINNLTEASIVTATESLLAEIPENSSSEIDIEPGPVIDEDFLIHMDINPSRVELSEIIQKTGQIKDQLMSSGSRVSYAVVRAGNEQNCELFVNRNKTLYQELNRWDLFYLTILKEGSHTNRIFSGKALQGGFEHMQVAENDIHKMVSDGEKILNAGRIKPGYYDCIFSPDMSGVFAHEAFGHGTETDMYLKQRAKGQEYMGKPVAAPMVNMIDSPAYPGQSGSFFFDHEGQLAADTQIIKNGILTSGMTDLNSAVRLKYDRTPNGRRENYAHKTYARMTNTYFSAGKDTLAEMIESIESGLYIDYMTSGMEDPKGWGIQLEALYAREIKDGKFTDNYFTPIIVTGYVPELLKSITKIGSDIKMHGTGYCGKGWKEWVKVSTGGPHLKLKARLA